MTPTELIWTNAGCPAHKFHAQPARGFCATCGAAIEGMAVHVDDMLSDTFSQHSDYLRFSPWICVACAWAYSYPKETHRNVLAAGERLWWPMISHDSATPERPCWLDVLRKLARLPADTPVAGVLTTDPKPRLWPRVELVSRAACGLYVHCPDYDRSGFVRFDLDACLSAAETVIEALQLGYSKRAAYFGLLTDYKRATKNIDAVMPLETRLQQLRPMPEFIPALLIAGVKKTCKT